MVRLFRSKGRNVRRDDLPACNEAVLGLIATTVAAVAVGLLALPFCFPASRRWVCSWDESLDTAVAAAAWIAELQARLASLADGVGGVGAAVEMADRDRNSRISLAEFLALSGQLQPPVDKAEAICAFKAFGGDEQNDLGLDPVLLREALQIGRFPLPSAAACLPKVAPELSILPWSLPWNLSGTDPQEPLPVHHAGQPSWASHDKGGGDLAAATQAAALEVLRAASPGEPHDSSGAAFHIFAQLIARTFPSPEVAYASLSALARTPGTAQGPRPSMDLHDFTRAVERLRPPWSDEQAAFVFRTLDVRHQGLVTVEDFNFLYDQQLLLLRNRASIVRESTPSSTGSGKAEGRQPPLLPRTDPGNDVLADPSGRPQVPITLAELVERLLGSYESLAVAFQQMRTNEVHDVELYTFGQTLRPPLTASEASYAFQGLDADRDGVVVYIEFLKVINSGHFFPTLKELEGSSTRDGIS